MPLEVKLGLPEGLPREAGALTPVLAAPHYREEGKVGPRPEMIPVPECLAQGPSSALSHLGGSRAFGMASHPLPGQA